MREFFQDVLRVDLSERAGAFLYFLENLDPCFLGLIVVALALLGGRMVAGQPAIRGWGLRLAVLTFLLYGGYKYAVTEVGSDHKHLLGIGLRALCMAGGVLAFVWMIVPIGAFVLKHLRLALAVFLLYGALLLIRDGVELSGEQSTYLVAQALLASGLALLIAWITEPFWKYVSENWLPKKDQPKPTQYTTAGPVEQVPPELVVPVQPEPPPRARATMLAPPNPPTQPQPTMRPSLEDLEEDQSRRRREKARLQVELAYVRVMPIIGQWFTRRMFEEFLQRHLGEHLTPEEVEANARQLSSVLETHLEQVHGEQQFRDMDELTQWLLAEQQRIQALPIDPTLKQSQMLDLHQRYLALAERLVNSRLPGVIPYGTSS